MTIRRARAADAPALYDICLRTGADGGDATAAYADPRLLAEVYVGPYLALEPDLAFVVADDDDVVGGYVQYFTGLPEVLVGLHMLGAAGLTASLAWTVLTLRER